MALSDVDENAWYYDSVKKLAESGIIPENGMFRPEELLTRRELVRLLWNMGVFNTAKIIEFGDVDMSDEDYLIISAAGGSGLMVGDENGPVSYTHLDVYKRQIPKRCLRK